MFAFDFITVGLNVRHIFQRTVIPSGLAAAAAVSLSELLWHSGCSL